MISKELVLKGLKDKNFLLSSAMYEYVCRFHLFDDKEINDALIEFINKNYDKDINYYGLIYSKLNKKILDTLISIHKKEKDYDIKIKIEKVFVSHYEVIKNIEYDFEKNMVDVEYLLMYKKIKHFCSKDPEKLFDMYVSNISDIQMDYSLEDEELFRKDILTKAMGQALIQTEEGSNLLIDYATKMNVNNIEREDFYEDYIPYMLNPLCKISNSKYDNIILNVFFDYIDFLAYADDINFYISNISDEKWAEYYIKILEGNIPEDYYYDILLYVNSDKVDSYLINKLKNIKKRSLKEDFLKILAQRFNKDVIPYIEEYIKENKIKDEEMLRYYVVPLFLLYNHKSEIAKKMIKEESDLV